MRRGGRKRRKGWGRWEEMDRGKEIAGIAWRVMWGVCRGAYSMLLEGWGFWILAGVLNEDYKIHQCLLASV